MRLRRLRRALPQAFASNVAGGGVPVPGSGPRPAAGPRDGKPRGVYAPDDFGPAVLPPPLTPDSVQPGIETDDGGDSDVSGPSEAFGRIGDALSGIPEWAARLADRLGLPIGAARVLTGADARSMRPKVIAALERLWDVLDATITHTNRRHADAVIWSTTSEHHTAQIADLLLKQATRAVGTAVFVRAIVDAYERYEVLGVLGINAYRSVAHYWLNGGVTALYWRDGLAAMWQAATAGGDA